MNGRDTAATPSSGASSKAFEFPPHCDASVPHDVPTSIAATLERARVVCDALGDADALQLHMRSFLAAAEQLLRIGGMRKPARCLTASNT